MARPRKNNADYFSHDAGMRNDSKVQALRNKYQHKGYAFWCMMLEALADADGFVLEIKTDVQLEIFAGDFRVSTAEMIDMLSFCSRIGLLTEENGTYRSENLIDRLRPMVEKREFLRQKYTKKVVSATETGVPTVEMPQSKVKESKVNNYYDLEKAISKWNDHTTWTFKGSYRNTTIKSIGLLRKCRGVTPQINTVWRKTKIKQEDWEEALKNYLLEIANRSPGSDYAIHRFSFYEFIKQKNGYQKFLNK